MTRLEELSRGTQVKGLMPDSAVTIIDIKWHGTSAIEVTYKDQAGHVQNELLFRDSEMRLEVHEDAPTWHYCGDGGLLRLAAEAYRIQLAHLFDPLLAVHSSLVEPLPHQLTAVYEEMLQRQPLRYLLADDPGAGKTIMAGLLIKELMMRGDVSRCLICAPGSLVEQWQDEMGSRFHLPFEIATRERIVNSRTGNPFADLNLVIGRLDQISRDEDLKSMLKQTDWDLIVVDEAHKMSAPISGGEAKETKRYKLGVLLGSLTRHLLLMTATPHNGKEDEFQLFMKLLDQDRFEGSQRKRISKTDTSDMMRRLTKEQLLTMKGTPLFPERKAYTVNYGLSDLESQLYQEVTEYVRKGMSRADHLAREGEARRGAVVGFALTLLQRRLASSPAAIHESVRRRLARLEKRLKEERALKHEKDRLILGDGLIDLTEEDLEELEEMPEAEADQTENRLIDAATTARTLAELDAEIVELRDLELLARKLRSSDQDRKWRELRNLLLNTPEMFDPNEGRRRKLVIFTEHRDTMIYLAEKIRALLGCDEALVTIDGSVSREERRFRQSAFSQDKEVFILLATDAAGEGVNLQCAHLMVNYDLPWNPNRLEQRFGRIHRIGQQEVCHLWNLVAMETREGEVFHRLFEKIEEERKALGGRVFDVLGTVVTEQELRALLIKAIQYGDSPEVRAKLLEAVDAAAEHKRIQKLLVERALTQDVLDVSRVQGIRDDMARAEARRLQPHFIRSFFVEAFRILGGTVKEREPRRYEISHVPSAIRSLTIPGIPLRVLPRYERICFDKNDITIPGKTSAEFVCPGHPLLSAVTRLINDRYRNLLQQGALLVDPADMTDDPRALYFLEHVVQDGRAGEAGRRGAISKQLQFVEMDRQGNIRDAGIAPYLDYRPLTSEEQILIEEGLEATWDRSGSEGAIISHAVEQIVPRHLTEVKRRREEFINRTERAVRERLLREIGYWDSKAEELKVAEQAGKVNAKLNSTRARQRAEDLAVRLEKRLAELEQEKRISALPPVIVGSALILPAGLLEQLQRRDPAPKMFAKDTAAIELAAMEAVMEWEREAGHFPVDVSSQKLGYDIESRIPETGELLFIEVKGRAAGARTVTVTKNEIIRALNVPEQYILAVVEIAEGQAIDVSYFQKPFTREPDFGVTSVNYEIDKLKKRQSASA